MAKGSELARVGCKYLGVPYSTMDCQAFVEKCLADCGIKKDLAGSNAWYRYIMQNGWVGTPAECKEKYGSIPVGAFLFILKQDGGEPEKYKPDGIGNASHIGIYTGMTGAEMVQIGIEDGDIKAPGYNYGDGAINSSNSRGAVCTSKFAGKSISGGWNRIGLWYIIDYGGGEPMAPYQAKVVGGALNLREQPSKTSERLCKIPDGTILTITDEAVEWAKTSYSGYTGWVMKQFLEKVDPDPGDTITVDRKRLEELYNLSLELYNGMGDLMGMRG